MSLENLLQQTVTIERLTDSLLAETDILPIITGFSQPSDICSLKLKISNISNSGSISIQGIVGVSPDSETISFTVPGTRQTTKEFSSIVTITSAGFSGGGKITIFQSTLSGEPIYKKTTIDALFKVRIQSKRGDLSQLVPGEMTSSMMMMYCRYISQDYIREKDRVLDGAIEYEISHIYSVFGRSTIPHHLEVDLRRL